MRHKVVQIITKLELGGAQEHVLFILKNLDRSLYEPVLITGTDGPLVDEARRIKDAKVYFLRDLVREISPVKDLRALVRMALLLRKERPALVHTNSSKAGILGRWAAKLADVPVIVHTVHGFGFNDDQKGVTNRVFVSLERVTSRVTTRFTAVARDNVDKGVREGIFSRGDAVVIRSGIDTAFFAEPGTAPAAKRAELGIPEGAPVATMVSCLKQQKAPVDFVKVAARVLEQVPDAHFIQAGDGELREEVLAEAGRLGISGRFHLLGWRRDVREIIHASDVIVLTSLWEGLPRVIPQAMAAGKPVVATAVDGTPEAVKDGVTGFLASPHDTEYMAEKVALLLGDKGLAAGMGKAGRAFVAEFDEGRMLDDLSALYEKLLRGR